MHKDINVYLKKTLNDLFVDVYTIYLIAHILIDFRLVIIYIH